MQLGTPRELDRKPSWLITNSEELHGTVYFEFLPGPYREKCWGPNSVFLDEETFGFIEPYFEKHVPSYGHYSFVEIDRSVWLDILEDLDSLAEMLDGNPTNADLSVDLGFFSEDTEREFYSHRAENIELLHATVRELSLWVQSKLDEFEVVSLLGV